jgi:hypothetical protein
MSRAGTGSRPSANALSAQANRIDACIRAGGAVTVAGLAGVAGAISYSHTRQPAAVDSEVAWRTRAFPLSVDGIEIVAALVLLADRRMRRRSSEGVCVRVRPLLEVSRRSSEELLNGGMDV